jgi:mono/diheme cytochrome c family protein
MNFRSTVLLTTLFILGTSLLACDYGRMKDQEAVQTYKVELPEMPENTVPATGGIQVIKESSPDKLHNPLPLSQELLDRGKGGYGNYCIMCHGSKFDGNGTVGQSFYPLPTNLKSPYIQDQNDGKLFYTITFGLNRHPGLGFMISETDRWAIVHYLRSLP